MFLREVPRMTLVDVADALDPHVVSLTVPLSDMSINAHAGVIALGSREVPVSEESLQVVGRLIQVPDAFTSRLAEIPETMERLFNDLIKRVPMTDVVARVTDDALLTLRNPQQASIEPRRIIEVAAKVMGEDAWVDSWYNGTDRFRLDAFVPETSERGIGGDPTDVTNGLPVVGDISAAGLSFDQNVKQNLAPKVGPLIYRWVCTNGMSIPDTTLKIDARGSSVDEVLAQLEIVAQRAFSRVEHDMEAFYAMRDEPVDNPERLISRLAAEARVSDRIRLGLIEQVPTILQSESDEVTMFDVVNFFTNMANDPTISAGERRILQTLGGTTVNQHVARCGACSSKIR